MAHGGTARLIQAVPVFESFEGKPVREGIVHVFDLVDHLKQTCAYAWFSPTDDSDKRQFFTIVHIPPIDLPLDAVRAAIVADDKADRSP